MDTKDTDPVINLLIAIAERLDKQLALLEQLNIKIDTLTAKVSVLKHDQTNHDTPMMNRVAKWLNHGNDM